jgi:hypothetical protein
MPFLYVGQSISVVEVGITRPVELREFRVVVLNEKKPVCFAIFSPRKKSSKRQAGLTSSVVESRPNELKKEKPGLRPAFLFSTHSLERARLRA